MAYDLEQVALIPMSCKPYHVAHDMLVRMAADECDRVELYVSLSDRGTITGDVMRRIWIEHIVPNLPSNVSVSYSAITPVRDCYERMGTADKTIPLPSVRFCVYGDADDTYRNFPDKSMYKYMPRLMGKIRIMRRGIERHELTDISGTQMREFLRQNDRAGFFRNLPDWMNKESVWQLLKPNRSPS